VITVLIGATGLVVGEILRRRVNRLGYRLPALKPDEVDEVDGVDESDEVDETALPSPGPRWWIPIVLGLVWAATTVLGPEVGGSHGGWSLSAVVLHAGWLAFSTVALWLAVIDLDVRRLPDSGQVLLAVIVVTCSVLLTWGHPGRLLACAGAAMGCGLVFFAIHAIGKGSMGLGDVKLVMTCAWWLALTSMTTVFAGLVAACLLAVLFAALTRARTLAFGPWLAAGTLVAGLLVA